MSDDALCARDRCELTALPAIGTFPFYMLFASLFYNFKWRPGIAQPPFSP